MDVGQHIMVTTKTKNDVFGTVIYRLERVGVDCPHCKGKDGMWFIMLGGTGSAVSVGRKILDCEKIVKTNIAKGITKLVSEKEAKAFTESSSQKDKDGSGIEVDY